MTFLPKRNRQDRIAPLLIIPLIATCFYQLLSSNITASAASGIDACLYFFASLVMAWTCVWIVAPWLSCRNRFATVAKQFVLMLFLGIFVLGGYYGFTLPENIFHVESQNARDSSLWTIGMFWGFASLCLVGISWGVGLRRLPDQPFRPMLRLLIAVPIATVGTLCLFAVTFGLIIFGFTSQALFMIPLLLIPLGIGGVFFAGFIYILNATAFLFSRRWPAIGERWYASFPGKPTPPPNDDEFPQPTETTEDIT